MKTSLSTTATVAAVAVAISLILRPTVVLSAEDAQAGGPLMDASTLNIPFDPAPPETLIDAQSFFKTEMDQLLLQKDPAYEAIMQMDPSSETQLRLTTALALPPRDLFGTDAEYHTQLLKQFDKNSGKVAELVNENAKNWLTAFGKGQIGQKQLAAQAFALAPFRFLSDSHQAVESLGRVVQAKNRASGMELARNLAGSLRAMGLARSLTNELSETPESESAREKDDEAIKEGENEFIEYYNAYVAHRRNSTKSNLSSVSQNAARLRTFVESHNERVQMGLVRTLEDRTNASEASLEGLAVIGQTAASDNVKIAVISLMSNNIENSDWEFPDNTVIQGRLLGSVIKTAPARRLVLETSRKRIEKLMSLAEMHNLGVGNSQLRETLKWIDAQGERLNPPLPTPTRYSAKRWNHRILLSFAIGGFGSISTWFFSQGLVPGTPLFNVLRFIAFLTAVVGFGLLIAFLMIRFVNSLTGGEF